MKRLLIVGCGDVAWRALPELRRRYHVFALLRNNKDTENVMRWRVAGAQPIFGDLDDRASLSRLGGLPEHVLHFAPPPNFGTRDTRTQALLASLYNGKSLPQRFVYISTTGVYGDGRGALIDETYPMHPLSERGLRRCDAEQQIRAFGKATGCTASILRVPGIYAAERLPLERLRKQFPALRAEDDVFTNHIHADDLAHACIAALRRGRANRCYNVCDDSQLRMGEYFDCVADAFALPRPPRIALSEAEQTMSPAQLSFMRESRRLINRRLKTELAVSLKYPTVVDGLRTALIHRNSTC